MSTVADRAFEVLEAARPDDKAGTVLRWGLVALIISNVAAVVLATVPGVGARFASYFHAFEVFSVVVFSVEYAVRLWCSTSSERYRGPLVGRLRFALTPLAIIDLLAILPFYLPALLPVDLRFLRALRLFRLVRMLKIARYSESLRAFANVFSAKKEELAVALAAIAVLLVIASGLAYQVEHCAQPEAFSSIPQAMWWALMTLTTVGYGDVSPITTAGKCITAVISILGIGVVALPAGILASGFAEEVQKRHRRSSVCPHCGKEI